MKNLIFATLLLLSACGERQNQPATPVRKEIDKKNPYVIHGETVTQSFYIESFPVTVSRSLVETSNMGDLALYTIRTSKQTLKFGIDRLSNEFIKDLPANYSIYLDESLKESAAETIDYKFSQLVSNIAMMNVLNVSRCVTAAVRKEIVALLQQPRNVVYFSVDTDDTMLTPLAITFDLTSDQFEITQNIPDGNLLCPSSKRDAHFILKPNTNVIDKNNNVAKDNVFLSPHQFASQCDYLYDISRIARPAVTYNNINDLYFPEYDQSADESNSQFMRHKITTIYQAFAYPRSVVDEDDTDQLLPELKNKAIENPLYKTFLKGFRHE